MGEKLWTVTEVSPWEKQRLLMEALCFTMKKVPTTERFVGMF